LAPAGYIETFTASVALTPVVFTMTPAALAGTLLSPAAVTVDVQLDAPASPNEHGRSHLVGKGVQGEGRLHQRPRAFGRRVGHEALGGDLPSPHRRGDLGGMDPAQCGAEQLG